MAFVLGGKAVAAVFQEEEFAELVLDIIARFCWFVWLGLRCLCAVYSLGEAKV